MLSESKTPIIEQSFREQYQRDGFLVVQHLLPNDLVSTLRDRIAAIGEGQVSTFPWADIEFEPRASGQSSSSTARKINRCAENDAVFMLVAQDERILDITAALIGPDIKLFGSQCFMKPPGGIEKPYHQDSAYFPIEPLSLVTCWIALDDVGWRLLVSSQHAVAQQRSEPNRRPSPRIGDSLHVSTITLDRSDGSAAFVFVAGGARASRMCVTSARNGR